MRKEQKLIHVNSSAESVMDYNKQGLDMKERYCRMTAGKKLTGSKKMFAKRF
jgi:hypothetical protein